MMRRTLTYTVYCAVAFFLLRLGSDALAQDAEGVWADVPTSALAVLRGDPEAYARYLRITGSDTSTHSERVLREQAQSRRRARMAMERTRIGNSAILNLAAVAGVEDHGSSLADEWRLTGKVEGIEVSRAPADQAQLLTTETIRIIGNFRSHINESILMPQVYLRSSKFNKVLVTVPPDWSTTYYEALLSSVPDHSVVVVFDMKLGEPGFDSIRDFMGAFEPKVWMVLPGGEHVANLFAWHRPTKLRLSDGTVPQCDPGYERTRQHLWSVTNYLNSRYPDVPVGLFFFNNRMTNIEFASALGYRPSAFFVFEPLDYRWGRRRLTPSTTASSGFRKSARDTIAEQFPGATLICHGQRLPYRRGLRSRIDDNLSAEIDGIFGDAREQGFAGACLLVR